MNTKNIAKNLFAGLLLTSALGTALAEAPYPAESRFVSTKSRAEVIAELQQARANGELLVSDRDHDNKPLASTTTREQVRAELAQARASGNMPVTDQ